MHGAAVGVRKFDFPKAVNPNRPDGRWRSGTQTGTINPNFNFVQQITFQSVDLEREIGVYWYLFSNHYTRKCIHKK